MRLIRFDRARNGSIIRTFLTAAREEKTQRGECYEKCSLHCACKILAVLLHAQSQISIIIPLKKPADASQRRCFLSTTFATVTRRRDNPSCHAAEGQ